MSKKEPIEITFTPGTKWVIAIYAIINLIILGGVYWSASLKQQPSATTTAQPITSPAVKQQTKPAQLPKAATMSEGEELTDDIEDLEDPFYKFPPHDNGDPE